MDIQHNDEVGGRRTIEFNFGQLIVDAFHLAERRPKGGERNRSNPKRRQHHRVNPTQCKSHAEPWIRTGQGWVLVAE